MKLLTILVIASIISGCFVQASQKELIIPGTLGPKPATTQPQSALGFLKVYSATEEHHVGKDIKYYPHTGYLIYNGAGQKYRYVPNHFGLMDEAPTLVSLPAGTYRVHAEDEDHGWVTLHVKIEPSRLTNVHLEGNWLPEGERKSSRFIQLSNGAYVGWSAQAIGPANGRYLASKP